jgi:hypothetical protein
MPLAVSVNVFFQSDDDPHISGREYLFTAYVGLNLFQSGITNWCPAMMLLKQLGLV